MRRFTSMVFEVINIEIERSIVGKTTITAVANDDDGTKVTISVPNKVNGNKEKIRECLIDKYNRILKEKPKVDSVSVGDIL